MPAPVSLRLQDAPRYGEFYGFTQRPFGADAGSRSFPSGGPHGRALDTLLQSIRARERAALLTGPAGSGKTTVCRAIPAQVEEAVLTALVLDPPASFDSLLRTLLQDFGVISPEGLRSGRVTGASRQELSQALGNFLRSLESIGGWCVVAIDEAHRVDAETLSELAALVRADGTAARMQIVLAGEPEIVERLAEPGMRALGDCVTTRVTLDSLGPEDVATYIADRIGAAGSSHVTFDAAAVRAIHRHTGGLPGAIDALCDRALSLGAQLEVRTLGGEVVEEAARGLGMPAETARHRGPRARWMWAVAALALLIAAWLSGAASALFR